MKAIRAHRFGDPDVLQLDEIEDPEVGPSQVRVAIHAVGINPVDTYIRAGDYGRRPDLPYIPGGDGSGVIDAIGPGVERFKVGDRVYTAGGSDGLLTGSHAEMVVLAQHQVQPLPDGIAFSQGAAIGVPYATAYCALFQKAEAQSGESVLIHGASGAVGLAAVQLAMSRGLRVIGTSSTARGRSLIEQQGAHYMLDHSSDDYLDALPRVTGGDGVDIILEMAAHCNLDRDLGAIAQRGRIVIIGSRGRLEIDPRGTMSKDASIHGMALFNRTRDEMASIHAGLRAGLSTGTLDPVVGPEFALADAAKGHRAVEAQEEYGKVVLRTDNVRNR